MVEAIRLNQVLNLSSVDNEDEDFKKRKSFRNEIMSKIEKEMPVYFKDTIQIAYDDCLPSAKERKYY